MANIPVTNIAQGLAGRAPGLIVQASGGGINSTPSISIRGGGAPIYVIDGVIRSAADFQNLSPDDIEAMSILKDASATAVYGSRATNGIIQVTTKRGKEGKPTVEYDFNMSFTAIYLAGKMGLMTVLSMPTLPVPMMVPNLCTVKKRWSFSHR